VDDAREAQSLRAAACGIWARRYSGAAPFGASMPQPPIWCLAAGPFQWLPCFSATSGCPARMCAHVAERRSRCSFSCGCSVLGQWSLCVVCGVGTVHSTEERQADRQRERGWRGGRKRAKVGGRKIRSGWRTVIVAELMLISLPRRGSWSGGCVQTVFLDLTPVQSTLGGPTRALLRDKVRSDCFSCVPYLILSYHGVGIDR
jgi:hypothetical protein